MWYVISTFADPINLMQMTVRTNHDLTLMSPIYPKLYRLYDDAEKIQKRMRMNATVFHEGDVVDMCEC